MSGSPFTAPRTTDLFEDQVLPRLGATGTSGFDDFVNRVNQAIGLPIEVTPNATPNSTVNVAIGAYVMPDGTRRASLKGGVIPTFAAGVISFSAGTITTGSNGVFTLPTLGANTYVRALIQYSFDSNAFQVTFGSSNAVLASAGYPAVLPTYEPVYLLELHSTAGGSGVFDAINYANLIRIVESTQQASKPAEMMVTGTSMILTINSTKTVTGLNGKNAALPQLNNVDLGTFTGTFNLSTGAVTGNANTFTPPALTANYYMRIGVEIRTDKSINLLFGAPAASLATAGAPGFSKTSIPLGEIYVQDNGGATSGSYLTPTLSQITEFGTGAGGSGSGSGSALGSTLPSLQFQAVFGESFPESFGFSTSSVNATSGFTNATYEAAQSIVEIEYDGTHTITMNGVSGTMSGAVSGFTVQPGDVAVFTGNGLVLKITQVNSQSSFIFEGSYSANPTSGLAVVISQCVHTKDIYNLTVGESAISSAFTGTFSEIMVDYQDAVSGGSIWVPNVAPAVAYVASTDDATWTTSQARPTSWSTTQQSTYCPTAGSSLYLRFFANEPGTLGVVSLISYNAFMQKALAASSGYVVNQAYGVTNISTAQSNLTVSLVGGKTTISLGWNYPIGANSGYAYGALQIYLDGKLVPRYGVAGATYTGAYYTEYSSNAIQLDSNYNTSAVDILIFQPVAVVDGNSTNTANIATTQAEMADGFQGYVSQANVLTATSTVGTPAAGTFYSAIVNRANVVDLSQDMKPRFGIERVMIENISAIQSEFGSSGEPVYGVLNDTLGKMRLIGDQWASLDDSSGQRANTTDADDYMEVTFYGTGLNVLFLNNSNQTILVATDGGAFGSTIVPSTPNAILSARNYSPNAVVSAVSGLALGIHTVTIKGTGTSTDISGVEIVNQFATGSNLVTVNPGAAYIGGNQAALSAQSTLAYNAAVTGTKGGRVVEYVTQAGVRTQGFTAAATSSTLYPGASHTNEEIVREFFFREFGAGRTDDFSRIPPTTAQVAAFTLDDDSTSLVSTSAYVTNTASTGQEGVGLGANATLMNFTFVGTGLDITVFDNVAGGADTYNFQIDGGATQSWPSTTGSLKVRTYKIVSGLAMGTHVFTMNRVTASTYTPSIVKFVVYQPITPSVPSGSVQMGTYNVLANYVANATAGALTLAQGILRKASIREIVYGGTGWSATQVGTNIDGWQIASATTSDTAQFTFFGTGFEFRFFNNATSSTWTIAVDGSTALNGFTTSSYGAGVSSFTASTGTLVTSTTSTTGNGIQVSNLTLGLHTVKLTKTAGTGSLSVSALDIITPVYSYKSNLYADIQNTSLVGSNSIEDDRLITPIKNQLPVSKAWSQAFGVTSSPTTTSTVAVPMPDMSCVIKTTGGPIDVSYSATILPSTLNVTVSVQIYIDGAAVGQLRVFSGYAAAVGMPIADRLIVPVGAGTHKIDVYWLTNTGTLTADLTERTLLAREF